MIEYSTQIINISTSSENQLRPNDIIGVHVNIAAFDTDKTSAYIIAWVPFTLGDEFLPYENVTNEMIASWLTTNSGAIEVIDSYKTTLADMIENIKNPPPPPLVLPETLVVNEGGVETVINEVTIDTIVNEALLMIFTEVYSKINKDILKVNRSEFISYVTEMINQAKILHSNTADFSGYTMQTLSRLDVTLDKILVQAQTRQDVVDAMTYFLTGRNPKAAKAIESF